MARLTDDAPITTRAARTRLPARHDPYWRGIEGSLALGYRKGPRGGTWVARQMEAGRYRKIALGRADDILPADGAAVLDYRQAQAKARDWAARQLRIAAGLEAEPIAPAQPYTVAKAIADYLADFAARGGKSVARTTATAEAHIIPALGALPVPSLTREKVRVWHRALAEKPARLRAKAGAAPRHREDDPADADTQRRRRASANRVLAVLKAALNHARAEGKVTCPDDAWAAVKPFRAVDQPKVRYLLDAEAARLVNACSPDLRAIVTAALLTGCRYGELAVMRAGDFDPRNRVVSIPRSKSGKARHVHLSDEGCTFFAAQAAGKAPSAPMFDRDLLVQQATKGSPAVIRRGRWGRTHQFRPLREACAAAKITPPIGFHILRHTYASRLAMNGVPMPVIAAQLGHADTRMTERHYAHMAPSYVADAVRAAFGSIGIVATPEAVVPFPQATRQVR